MYVFDRNERKDGKMRRRKGESEQSEESGMSEQGGREKNEGREKWISGQCVASMPCIRHRTVMKQLWLRKTKTKERTFAGRMEAGIRFPATKREMPDARRST